MVCRDVDLYHFRQRLAIFVRFHEHTHRKKLELQIKQDAKELKMDSPLAFSFLEGYLVEAEHQLAFEALQRKGIVLSIDERYFMPDLILHSLIIGDSLPPQPYEYPHQEQIVGRTNELARLRGFLIDGKEHVTSSRWPPGAGKSILLETFAQQLQQIQATALS